MAENKHCSPPGRFRMDAFLFKKQNKSVKNMSGADRRTPAAALNRAAILPSLPAESLWHIKSRHGSRRRARPAFLLLSSPPLERKNGGIVRRWRCELNAPLGSEVLQVRAPPLIHPALTRLCPPSPFPPTGEGSQCSPPHLSAQLTDQVLLFFFLIKQKSEPRWPSSR